MSVEQGNVVVPGAEPQAFVLRNEGPGVFDNMRQRSGLTGQKSDSIFEKEWSDLLGAIYTAIEDGFARGNGVEIYVFDSQRAYQEINRRVDRRNVVALDPLYPDYTVHHPEGVNRVEPLRVSRWFKPGTKDQLGVFGRPVFPPVEVQLQRIASRLGSNEVVVVEDDGFTFSTLTEMISQMEQAGIPVREVFLGMHSGKPNNLKVPVTAVVSFADRKLKDVMDGRNSAFGTYTAGAVIFYEDGTVGRWPYIPPFVDPEVRISLPPESVKAYSTDVLEANIVFFDKVQSQNGGRPIRLQDVSYSFRVALDHVLPGIQLDTPMQQVGQAILRYLEASNFAVTYGWCSGGNIIKPHLDPNAVLYRYNQNQTVER